MSLGKGGSWGLRTTGLGVVIPSASLALCSALSPQEGAPLQVPQVCTSPAKEEPHHSGSKTRTYIITLS